MNKVTIVFLMLITSLTVNAQRHMGSGNSNRIGLQGKVTLTDINTSNFELESGTGFLGGLTTRGRWYNNFGVVYGIDFLSSSVNIQTRALGATQSEDTPYNIVGAQVNLLLSYEIIDNHLAIDLGPALLVNSKMKVKNSRQENNIVSGYTNLKAKNIQGISRINGFGVVGLTGGLERVRITLQYHYGFTNIFNNLNDEGLLDIDGQAANFKGTASLISGGLVFYL